MRGTSLVRVDPPPEPVTLADTLRMLVDGVAEVARRVSVDLEALGRAARIRGVFVLDTSPILRAQSASAAGLVAAAHVEEMRARVAAPLVFGLTRPLTDDQHALLLHAACAALWQPPPAPPIALDVQGRHYHGHPHAPPRGRLPAPGYALTPAPECTDSHRDRLVSPRARVPAGGADPYRDVSPPRLVSPQVRRGRHNRRHKRRHNRCVARHNHGR